MARRRVQKLNIKPHVRRIKAHHKRHKKRLLKLFHKVRSHPGCYQPGVRPRGGRAPKSLPRQPAGLNKKGAGLWSGIKKAWNWITGHKVVQDMKNEVTAHAKKQALALAQEAKSRAVGYAKAQVDRGSAWLKRQGSAAAEKIRGKVEGHLSNVSNKVEGIANRVDKVVSSLTGATDDMPGKVVGAKKGKGFTANFRKQWGTGRNLQMAGRMAQRIGTRIARRQR